MGVTLVPKKDILTFRDIDEAAKAIIKRWYSIAEKAINKRGFFTVALSGGKTPIALYRKLAGLPDVLPWFDTFVFFVDERFVSSDHPDNNQRMIHESLLGRVGIPQKNVNNIITGKGNPVHAAMAYEDQLKDLFEISNGELPEFDLIILGIGADGHTASLFSDDTAKDEKDRLVLSAHSKHASYDRVTLSVPVINNAQNIFFLVTGKEKAAIVKKVIDHDRSLPASMVNPPSGTLSFYLDQEAAFYLSKQD